MRIATIAALVALLLPAAAAGGSVLDRIRHEDVLQCGGVVRPGLAFAAQDGTWHGLEVDLCHAIAVAALGVPGKFAFHGYAEAPASYDRLRHGDEDLAFLTGSEILAQGLLASIVPGPPVFFDTTGVMVHAAFNANWLGDLNGKRVCVEPGTGPERVARAAVAATARVVRRPLAVTFVPFQEAGEMLDGFYNGHCDAIVDYSTRLAVLRLQADAAGHPARLMPTAIDADPLLAATPLADGQWTAIVAWAVATLQLADQRHGSNAVPSDATDALPLDGTALGLAADWQAAMLAANGSYGEMFDRNLGSSSRLDMPKLLNGLSLGGLFTPPRTQ